MGVVRSLQAGAAMWRLVLILSLPLMATATAAPSPTSSSSSSGGSSLAGLAASGAAGVVLGMAFAPVPDCRDVGIDANLCAVMYDEEKCLRTGAFKSLLPGEAGKLPLLTRGLRRNDAESLIVRDRCKLELWDHADDLDLSAPADLVIDRMPGWKVGNKYVDSLDDDYEEMNEAISAFRCTCRESMWG